MVNGQDRLVLDAGLHTGGAACGSAGGVGWTGSFQPALPQSPVHSSDYGNSVSQRDADLKKRVKKYSWSLCPALDFLKQQKEGDSVFAASLLADLRRKYFKTFHCDVWMLSLEQKPCTSCRSCWVRLQSPEGLNICDGSPGLKTYEFVHFCIY